MRIISCFLILIFFSTLANADIATNLSGWWKFDDGSGASAVDSSGNGDTGTLLNSPAWVTGKLGGALSFNGSTQYVDAGNGSSLNLSGNVTMCMWVYSLSGNDSSWHGIMAKRNDSLGTPYAYGINFNKGSSNFQIYTSAGSGIANFGSYILPDNTWVHLCGVMSSSPTALYVNGSLYGTTGSGGGIATNTADFCIGDSGFNSGVGQEFFNGSIDDVRIYNRVLSAADVAQLYKAQAPFFLNHARLNNFHS